ncbi:2-C-methyl-D-erythritol 4-phosphate cytidylyltransferase [Vogesella alkaliphila]|uniref:2-C-methyl-D-erythritol 4-phosphate cytidylyltransferase n=1 Tax=Vogesella alkaliphila TaxID=1193621 RepID=A0ABQ2YNV7_9NEIS|nr:2-C-methyl-D-erythritol 4-phosphate cytidylyltransferase [Vogesella alkaliphila]GGX89993.1 2-C-methyl-D-erythritol 4-phosphate cytidylyltransferase [Vogesella alkaliphila]
MSACIALVPAAGHGSRFGAATPKQYLPLAGRPLLAHTLDVLCRNAAISRVAVVISPGDEWFDSFDWPQPKLEVLRVGGPSRAESVAGGLAALAADADDWVLVHDAARCCLSDNALQRLIDGLQDDAVGGLLAQPVADTVKRASPQGRVAATVPRDGLWLAQTPQMFRAGLLAEALHDAANPAITDEASAIELLGHAPRLVEGEAQNFKVTWPQDLALAGAILAAHKG